jgi:transcription initiation factor TFIIB
MARLTEETEFSPKLTSGSVDGCPECGSKKVVRDSERSELVCRSCGFVITERIPSQGPEWRAFNPEQRAKRRRVGMPETLSIHDKGLSTTIDWRNRDSTGRVLPSAQRFQIYRMRRLQRRARFSSTVERNLARALGELNAVASRLNLPRNTIEQASTLYRKLLKNTGTRGRSISGCVVACLYMACRQSKISRSLDELAVASSINKKEIGRCYRWIYRKLDMKIPISRADTYISRFANRLDLPAPTETLAYKIVRVLRQVRLTSGRSPVSIAAAAMYVASTVAGKKRTQGDISRVANVTEVTIRNRYKELLNSVEIVVRL